MLSAILQVFHICSFLFSGFNKELLRYNVLSPNIFGWQASIPHQWFTVQWNDGFLDSRCGGSSAPTWDLSIEVLWPAIGSKPQTQLKLQMAVLLQQGTTRQSMYKHVLEHLITKYYGWILHRSPLHSLLRDIAHGRHFFSSFAGCWRCCRFWMILAGPSRKSQSRSRLDQVRCPPPTPIRWSSAASSHICRCTGCDLVGLLWHDTGQDQTNETRQRRCKR